MELERFLKSFHALRAYLSVTLLARFNKNRLIFLVILHSIKPSFEYNNPRWDFKSFLSKGILCKGDFMISNISIHPKTMFKNALNIQDFSFKSHTSTAIIGTNGAGKSTLINTILGIRSDYNFKAQNNNIPYHDDIITQAIGSCL